MHTSLGHFGPVPIFVKRYADRQYSECDGLQMIGGGLLERWNAGVRLEFILRMTVTRMMG